MRTTPFAPCVPAWTSASHAADLKGPDGIPLRLRVGINTGEVLARMAVQPGSGDRFLAGDAINTASRIQSAAPEMGVAVGLETYEATRTAINYAELEAVHLKGKVRAGADLPRHRGTVPNWRGGHPDEYRRLHRPRRVSSTGCSGLFSEIGANPPVKLVTVVAEAGMGKSRLLLELRAALATDASVPDLAPGPLPALRRRHHLLGTRRDRQGGGRHPGVGSGVGGASQAGGGHPRRDRFDVDP